MPIKKPIMLVGLMGAGKTTLGVQLARKLGVKFVDSDNVISEQAGVSIPEIFERDGESFFRKVEAKTIRTILETENQCVLATGGGAFISKDVRAAAKEFATTIWLKADLETLVARVEHNNHRPLLNNVDKRDMLKKLIDERYPIYAEADIIVDTNSNSRGNIMDEILAKLGIKNGI